jgi:hypothetical protein
MNTTLEKYMKTKKRSEQRVIIGGGGLILGVISFIAGYSFTMVLGGLLIVTGLVFLVLGMSEFQKLSKQFKREVVGSLVEEFVDNGHFDPHSGLSQSDVYSTEFLKRADRFHSEDLLRGTIDGVDFVSSDVKLEERHVQHTKNGTRVYYETYFLGRIFVFEFNKTFEGTLQVLEGGRPTVNRGYNKVKLESVDFNKKFRTYATSEHSAFYVLTPHFMEALMSFEKNNRGKISFSFLGSKLFIGINNFRDTFELQMFRTLDDRIFDEFKRDLYVVKEVVTELKLNKNIFKKGA